MDVGIESMSDAKKQSDAVLLEYATELAKALTPRHPQRRGSSPLRKHSGRRIAGADRDLKNGGINPRTVSLSHNQYAKQRVGRHKDASEYTWTSEKKRTCTVYASGTSDFPREDSESDESSDSTIISTSSEGDEAAESDEIDYVKDSRPTKSFPVHYNEGYESEDSNATDTGYGSRAVEFTHDIESVDAKKCETEDPVHNHRSTLASYEMTPLRRGRTIAKSNEAYKPKHSTKQTKHRLGDFALDILADETNVAGFPEDCEPANNDSESIELDAEYSADDNQHHGDAVHLRSSNDKTLPAHSHVAGQDPLTEKSARSGLLYSFGAEFDRAPPNGRRGSSEKQNVVLRRASPKEMKRRGDLSDSTNGTSAEYYESVESDSTYSSYDYDDAEADDTGSSTESDDDDMALASPRRMQKTLRLAQTDGQSILATTSRHYDSDLTTKRKRKKSRLRKPVRWSQKERNRRRHNDAVKQRVARKKARRTHFLASNIETMRPFLDDRVIEHLLEVSCGSVDYKEPALSTQPDAIQGKMRDYQLEGLNWMIRMHGSNLGMILGDEMGLGKTLQTIALFCHLKEREGVSGPSLVLCPLSVLQSWSNELARWAPSLKVFRLHSSTADELEVQKVAFRARASEYDVVLATYEAAKCPRLRSLWSHHYFNYLVLDEGHRIKDVTTQNFRAVRLIHSENILILTGTPLQNNMVELWSILHFIYPDVFLTKDRFAEAFDLTRNVVEKEMLLQAHSLLALFMLRRLKSEVEKSMPKKVETMVLCPLSKMQASLYKSLLMKDINMLVSATSHDKQKMSKKTRKELENLIMQLRKCCLHPFLFEGAEIEMESTTCKDLVAASGKLSVLDMLLRSLYSKRHRVVIFSQFKAVLDILEDYCTSRGYTHCRLDGQTRRAKRNLLIKQFNAPGRDIFIFLMSTRAGGMGLNLQTADTCILFDSDWNPQPDIQAAARVHRIGQKKTVHVYRLVVGGSIEERMVERAQKKLYLDQMVNQDATVGVDQDIRLSKGELLAAIKFGCDAVFGENGDLHTLPTDQDIDLITNRNRSETFSNGKLKGGATNRASEFNADEKFTSTLQLGGIDFKAIRDQLKRQRSTNTARGLDSLTNTLTKSQKANEKCETENLEGRAKKQVMSKVDFDSQDFCQVCGGGGLLLCCSRCPVAVHKECLGLINPDGRWSCSHHSCYKCQRTATGAGGLLFPCQSCPLSFCEDCLPTEEIGLRILDTCDRFAKLGFNSHLSCYIHCSASCEEVAKKEFGWLCQLANVDRAATPPALDLSQAFGSHIHETIGTTVVDDISQCDSQSRKTDDSNIAMKGSEGVIPDGGCQSSEQEGTVAPAAPLPTKTQDPSIPASERAEVECDAVFPWTKDGYLFEVRNKGKNTVVFGKYRPDSGGRKGPAESANRVRAGDRLVQLNQVDIRNFSFHEVVSLLRRHRREKRDVVVRFLAAQRASSPPSKRDAASEPTAQQHQCTRVKPGEPSAEKSSFRSSSISEVNSQPIESLPDFARKRANLKRKAKDLNDNKRKRLRTSPEARSNRQRRSKHYANKSAPL